VELVVTEHIGSDRRPAPAYSTDGRSWVPLRPQALPGRRTAGCEARWAQWRTRLEIKQDTTVMVRAAEDSPPGMHAALPLRVTSSPLVWRREIAQSGDTWWRSQPVVAGPLVIIGENTGVRALRADDGKVAWEHREAARWLGTVLAVGDRVVATSWESDVVALSLSDGRVLWRAKQECAIPPSQPAAAGRFVVVGGMKRDGIWDGSLTCLELATGDVHWSRRYDHPFFSTPLVAGGRLWASCGDVVHCFEVDSGKEVWAYHPEHFSLYGQMVIVRGRLLAPDADGWVYVLDPQSGKFLERFLLPRGVGLASDGQVLYVPAGCRGLRAYDPLHHRELWSIHRPGSYFVGIPTLRTRDLVVASSDGNVYVVDKSSGQVTWSHQVGDVGGAMVALDGERGYVITGDGELLAFHLPQSD
jgi:outer membrane protein assembly factor BamB